MIIRKKKVWYTEPCNQNKKLWYGEPCNLHEGFYIPQKIDKKIDKKKIEEILT